LFYHSAIHHQHSQPKSKDCAAYGNPPLISLAGRESRSLDLSIAPSPCWM